VKHACAIGKLDKTFLLKNSIESTTGEMATSERAVVKMYQIEGSGLEIGPGWVVNFCEHGSETFFYKGKNFFDLSMTVSV